MPKETWTYLGNQHGYSETGRILLYDHLIPRIRAIGLEVFEPFAQCEAKLGFNLVKAFPLYEDRVKFWKENNRKIGRINKKGMKESRLMTPDLDGGHTVDEGVANEIGHYAANGYGRVITLRTDIRMSENLGAIVNTQIKSDIFESGGKICTSLEEWYKEIEEEYKRLQHAILYSRNP